MAPKSEGTKGYRCFICFPLLLPVLQPSSLSRLGHELIVLSCVSFISILWFIVLNSCVVCYCATFPGGSDGKESTCNAGDAGSIIGSGKSSGEENGYPLQYFSCLENLMDKGAWRAIVHGVEELDTTEVTEHTQHILLYMCTIFLPFPWQWSFSYF